jgi:hypothetical protein
VYCTDVCFDFIHWNRIYIHALCGLFFICWVGVFATNIILSCEQVFMNTSTNVCIFIYVTSAKELDEFGLH